MGPAILVVDDEEAVLDFIALVLVSAGYSVITAGAGWEAIRLCREKCGSLKLIVADVMMPGITGPQIETALESEGIRIPMLYVSGYAIGDDMLQDRPGARPVHFLSKPFSPSDLLHKSARFWAPEWARVREVFHGARRQSGICPILTRIAERVCVKMRS